MANGNYLLFAASTAENMLYLAEMSFHFLLAFLPVGYSGIGAARIWRTPTRMRKTEFSKQKFLGRIKLPELELDHRGTKAAGEYCLGELRGS